MKFRNTVIKKVILLSLILSFGCAGIFGIIGDGNAQISCDTGPTPNFPTGCDLLLNYDVHVDGKIDVGELTMASIDEGTGIITIGELNFMGSASVAGSINDFCGGLCYCNCAGGDCCRLGCAAPGDPDCSCAENTGTCCGTNDNCTGSTMNSNSFDCPQSECCQNASDCPSGLSPLESLNLSDKSISDIVEDLINWILTIAVVVAIIMLIVGGILYIMAAGDETRILLAKKIVTYAILGLLVIGLSYVIVKETANIIEGNYTNSTSPPGWVSCGDSITFNYKGSSVTYGTVSHNGECWLDRNLGASQVATAYNDSAAYGDLFQWGRLDDGHQTMTSGTTSTNSSDDDPGHANFILENNKPRDWRVPQNNNLWQGVGGINNPCPSGWRMPTESEWNAERSSWGSNDYNGAYATPLKLVVAGYRNYGSGSLSNMGSYGHYWSSAISGTSARDLSFSSSDVSMTSNYRANGFSVRCLKH